MCFCFLVVPLRTRGAIGSSQLSSRVLAWFPQLFESSVHLDDAALDHLLRALRAVSGQQVC
jgi:hypothetical protein